ncbi:hypothetical protein BC835DRAFT_924839 [Cytidiella melzeri]|nr:hypothetical protein BC835DRAFT_924839 [Cytidiella melzeri]
MEAILTVQQLHWAFIRRYLNAAGTTLALWDHVLTVGDEIEYFWSRKSWTPSTMLFLGFRYITMLGLIFMAAISAGSIRPTVQMPVFDDGHVYSCSSGCMFISRYHRSPGICIVGS